MSRARKTPALPEAANDDTGQLVDLAAIMQARASKALVDKYLAAPQIGRSPESALLLLMLLSMGDNKFGAIYEAALAFRHHAPEFMGALQFLDKATLARRSGVGSTWPA